MAAHEQYKMIVKEVTGLGQDALDNPQKYKAFLGVSIRNKFFSKKVLRHYVKWMSEMFEESIILLMDDPDRHNLSAFNGLNESQALEKARAIAADLKRGYEKTIRENMINNVSVKLFSELSNNHYLDIIDQKVRSHLKQDHQMKSKVHNLVYQNVGSKIRQHMEENPEISETDLTNSISEYLIEEIAPLIYLTELGYQIELDPHIEFPIKKMAYEGMLPDLSSELELEDRGHIFLYPEGYNYQPNNH